MIGKIYSIRGKQIIIAVTIILVWQLSYPYNATAQEITNIEKRSEQNSITALTNESTDIPIEQMRLPVIPTKPQPEAKRTLKIAVTAYSSTPDQTSGDPFITASGTRVHDGTIAANFLPIGTRVRFPEKYGNKIFTVEDRMHQRYWQKADIWMETRAEAKEWGVRYTTIEIL